jgi:hypothetical protein
MGFEEKKETRSEVGSGKWGKKNQLQNGRLEPGPWILVPNPYTKAYNLNLHLRPDPGQKYPKTGLNRSSVWSNWPHVFVKLGPGPGFFTLRPAGAGFAGVLPPLRPTRLGTPPQIQAENLDLANSPQDQCWTSI